jgi:hypothetical protein
MKRSSKPPDAESTDQGSARPDVEHRPKKRTAYWRNKKREQRKKLRDLLTKRLGPGAYRRFVREDRRMYRARNYLPVAQIHSDRDEVVLGPFGRRGSLTVKRHELAALGLTIVGGPIPPEVLENVDHEKIDADIATGRPLDSYSYVELQRHALILVLAQWGFTDTLLKASKSFKQWVWILRTDTQRLLPDALADPLNTLGALAFASLIGFEVDDHFSPTEQEAIDIFHRRFFHLRDSIHRQFLMSSPAWLSRLQEWYSYKSKGASGDASR